MMNKSNFEFLKGVNDFTYAIACAAENNYPDDPNTTLIKMRMFGEATAKHLGLLLNIPLVRINTISCANSAKSPSLMTTFSLYSTNYAALVTGRCTNTITISTMPRCACDSGSARLSGTTVWSPKIMTSRCRYLCCRNVAKTSITGKC